MIDPQIYSAGMMGSQGANGAATVYAGDARMAGAMPDIAKQSSDAQAFSKLVRNAQNGTSSSGSSGKAGAQGASQSGATKKSGGFMDFLTTLFDIINPLEHIPIISTIYEQVTGHHMNPIARIAGDTLYGGPIGAAVGVANVIVEKSTGKDLGENMIAMVTGKGSPSKGPAAQVAQNSVPATTQNTPVTWDQKVLWDQPGAPAQTAGTIPAQTAGAISSTPRTRGVDADLNTSNNLSSLQGANAVAPAPVPRAQIAQQMMEGLDKYAALKKDAPAASFSAAY